jgi:CheY-like chemotaxis protein
MIHPLHSDLTLRRGRARVFPRHRSYAAFVESHHPRVLLADDDDDMRTLLAARLQRDGFQVTTVSDGMRLGQALRRTDSLPDELRDPFDVVVSDIRMPGRSGFDALAEGRDGPYAAPFIVITGFLDRKVRLEAERLGASALFEKPFDLDDLCIAVAHLVGA